MTPQKNVWEIVEADFDISKNHTNESIFSLGNGYLGMRGNFEEGIKGEGTEGTYINGYYELEDIHYEEVAYGYPDKSQTMLNVINGKYIKLYIDNEEFDMTAGELLSYRRAFDMKKGTLRRELIWSSTTGKVIKLETERLISFTNKRLAAIEYCVTPTNFSGNIKIVSLIDGNSTNESLGNDPRIGSGIKGSAFNIENKSAKAREALMTIVTKNSRKLLSCAVEHVLDTECSYSVIKVDEEKMLGSSFEIDGIVGKSIKLSKYISYVSSKEENLEEAEELAIASAAKSKTLGFPGLMKEQKSFLEDFWKRADVEIDGDDELQQAIRFNMFHLLQSTGTDGDTNIAAKGLTGEGYGGHYFWDTEMYVMPFYCYTKPEINRSLLEYRYNTMDNARNRAREMAHKKGVLFPWRTIDGNECSAYFPAGTAQYHINADIAFSIKRYMEATGDEEFLVSYGAEILFETARLWADLGFFNSNNENKFCINCVTGPDEYTAIVNNNCYTNLMARENLRFAYLTALWLKDKHIGDYERVINKIGLEEAELELWNKAAESMYIPYNEKLKLHLQDDSFLDKKVWDFENTPKENYPLLLHYHPLVIYRHQVCKQADLVLASFLLSDCFDKEQKRRDYDYYEKVTTHDSSLSACIFSIVASDVGYHEKAYSYFMKTAGMDLGDYHGNTKHGVHTANMAGSWMGIVNGFGGMRVTNGGLCFSPYLPEQWNSYSFRVSFRGCLLKVDVNKAGFVYTLLEGSKIAIKHYDKVIELTAGEAPTASIQAIA